MEYTIDRKRVLKYIDSLIKYFYPEFNRKDSEKMTWHDGDRQYIEYYKGGKNPPFAKYWVWENELQLNKELFKFLESHLEGELLGFVLDWFNQEFKKDAENLTHY